MAEKPSLLRELEKPGWYAVPMIEGSPSLGERRGIEEVRILFPLRNGGTIEIPVSQRTLAGLIELLKPLYPKD
jgi:propanediol utilization protein